MKHETTKTSRGFSMIELLVATALGVVLMGVATQIFRTGMDATRLVTQRAEMQQDTRAAIDLISKDINMAGSGLPSGGVQLPTGGAAVASWYGCNQLAFCYLPTHNYPNANYLYGILPGPLNGVENNVNIPATGRKADSITVLYVDYSFPLNQYTTTFVAPGNGTTINLAPPVPAPVPALPAVNDPAVGMKLGDLVLLTNNVGSAIGEVTGVGAGSLAFANLDALHVNQQGVAVGSIGGTGVAPNTGITTGVPTTAYRMLAVSYFIEVPINGQLPRLMRQVNGQNAVPVSDNIIDLELSYDMFDDATGVATTNVKDPIGAGFSPAQIRKVNVSVLGQSLWSGGNKSQSMVLATSVSARNMSFKNRYN